MIAACAVVALGGATFARLAPQLDDERRALAEAGTDGGRVLTERDLAFIVNRPPEEPGFHLERHGSTDRRQRYTIRSYAADRPAGERYG